MKKEIKGLTKEEVNERIKNNQINYLDEPKTKTVKEIIKTNTFTYFNFLNILLGSLVIISGLISGRILYSLKNSLFVGVIFTNTIISIVEEILAKKTIDKLNVINDTQIKVLRDGQIKKVKREELVLDADIKRTMLIKRERTVALYFLRFLLKFLDASIPSKPNNLYVSFDVFILFFLMLTSPVCLIASIAGLRAALAAGMLADIITVTKHMTAAATSACHVM